MVKLKRIVQDDVGHFYLDGRLVDEMMFFHMDKIRTIVFKNPVDVEAEMEKYVENYPSSIPKNANCYVISDFNGGTQKVFVDDKGKEHMLSVYAVQFYTLFL